MPRYAQSTSVPVERSRAEIEAILQRFGATQFISGWTMDSPARAMIQFVYAGRQVRFILTLPEKGSPEFTRTPSRHNERSPRQAELAYAQAQRQRWRSLALSIKAKLVAVQDGIAEFESEFLANIVDPQSGRTVGEVIRPQLETSYQGNGHAPLLLAHE